MAAGFIAEQWLKLQHGIEIVAWVTTVGSTQENTIKETVNFNEITREEVRQMKLCVTI